MTDMDPATLTLGGVIAFAAFAGFFHTLTGPDHFVPFIAMARAGGWSLRRTIAITSACGVGHILGSIALGGIGIVLGMALDQLKLWEDGRGNIAGWLLLGFGLAYMAWGLVRGIRNRPHSHTHGHADGSKHVHEHTHSDSHVHAHQEDERRASITPWALFAIFVFGPCEVLIPLMMAPAVIRSTWGVVAVCVAFAATTLATMLTIVIGAYFGLAKFSFPRLERFSHAIAGGTLALCGGTIQFLGW